MDVSYDGRGDKCSQRDRTSDLAFLVALEAERATQETFSMDIRFWLFFFPRIPLQATKLHTRDHSIEPLYTKRHVQGLENDRFILMEPL
jgi:hypothetical protein